MMMMMMMMMTMMMMVVVVVVVVVRWLPQLGGDDLQGLVLNLYYYNCPTYYY